MDFKGKNLGSMVTKIYKDRVVQADVDFYCYFVADIDKPLVDNMNHLIKLMDENRKLVGAEFMNAHITLGSKGGRHEIATIKPYQKDRKDSEIKARVRELRQELANWAGTDNITVIANVITEADDSIGMYHLEAMRQGKVSIIDSGDKDLNMIDGIHKDAKSGKLIKVTGYGKTEYKEVGNVKPKLVGYGKSWFWHQMLMGDSADGIPGLEKLTGELLNIYIPTKTLNKNRKSQPCGEKKAVAILSDVNSDFVAGTRTLDAYLAYYGDCGVERFVEQAFLLWMRRNNNEWDVLDYFKEIGLKGIKPSDEQLRKVENWKQMMIGIHGGQWFERK